MAAVTPFDDEDQTRRQPADVAAPQPQPKAAPDLKALGFGGFNANNVFDNWDLNPLANQIGGGADGVRDTLATQRDAYLQPLMQQYRQQRGVGDGRAAADDAGLFHDQGFQSFVQTGSMQNAIASAQNGGGASRDQYNISSPGFQFNDPYTKQLEDVAQQQIGNLSQPQSNPQLETLLQFLGKRFDELTTTPGYSPDDLAVMRTQALDPIEQDRAASNQRALQRAAAGGFLPTSGITHAAVAPNGGTETIDATYDRMRAAAQRDLAIKAIDKRNADLNQAVNVGQLAGVTIPQGQRQEDQQRRSELVSLAQLLYNLPRQAMLDAQGVVQGTSNPNDVFTQGLQAQQQQVKQQREDAQKWASIGQLIAQMAF